MPHQVAAVFGHNCIATDHSTSRIPVYPLAAPLLRVVREEESPGRFLAVKGAVHDLVSLLGWGAENQREWPPETSRPALMARDTVEVSSQAQPSRRPGQAYPSQREAAQLNSHPQRNQAHPPMQQLTSGHRGEPQRIWLVPEVVLDFNIVRHFEDRVIKILSNYF